MPGLMSRAAHTAARVVFIAGSYCILTWATHLIEALVETVLRGSTVDANTMLFTGARMVGFAAWFCEVAWGTLWVGMACGVAMLVFVPADLAYQKWGAGRGGPIDWRYYPRLEFIRHSTASVKSFLIVGSGVGAAVFIWWNIAIEIVRADNQGRLYGMMSVGDRLPASVFLLWGALWFADALQRPKQGTSIAAYGFLFLAVFYALLFGPHVVFA